MKTILTFLAFIVIGGKAFAQEADFSWLIGVWKLKGNDIYEVWTRKAVDQTLSGVSFRVNGLDTTITEVISLEYNGGSYHYIPDIAGPQPPIDFKITSLERYAFIAENPHHDFPKKIQYRLISAHPSVTLEAAIEGDGKRITYSFQKMK